MLNWIKQVFSKKPVAGVLIGPNFDPFQPRAGKSDLSKVIDQAIEASGAQAGDIVEIDGNGMARVVGRRPALAGQEHSPTEHAIRATLRELYGEDVPILADVKRGSNIVVFRNQNAK